MTNLTARLGEFVASVDLAAHRGDFDDNATPAIVDSIGVIVAGHESPAGRAVSRWARATAPSGRPDRWWDRPRSGPPELAALATSTCGHALDFDDVLPGAGHPSSILLSAIMAAPLESLPGRAVLDAFVVGYEVNARLSRAVGHQHYKQGWHTTCTIGGFGATAAVARLLGLDASTTRQAFGIVASLASGLQRNFGSMTKPLHSGLAARNGVLAAQLAAAGFTADDSILDGKRGFIDIYAVGAPRFDALDDLGARWAICAPGPTLKKYACALEVYRAVEGVLLLRQQHALAVDRVAALSCVVPPGTMGPLRHDDPADGMEAKFSMPYTVASALVDGELTLASFADDAVRRADVRRAMRLVHVREDVRCRPEDPSGRNSSASFGGFVEVEIETTTGTRHTTVVHDVIGSPTRPLAESERKAKFAECLGLQRRDLDAAARLFDDLTLLPSHNDLRAVLRAVLS